MITIMLTACLVSNGLNESKGCEAGVMRIMTTKVDIGIYLSQRNIQALDGHVTDITTATLAVRD